MSSNKSKRVPKEYLGGVYCMLETAFYVYRHIRLDTGSTFYVGKGTGKRAYWKYRSKYWKNIVSQTEISIEIVKDGLTEKEAFDLEVETIAHYKALKQCECNFTNGGSGGNTRSGKAHSEETKLKMSQSAAGRVPWIKGKKRGPMTEEHKLKLRTAKLGKKRPDLIGKTGPKRRKNALS